MTTWCAPWLNYACAVVDNGEFSDISVVIQAMCISGGFSDISVMIQAMCML